VWKADRASRGDPAHRGAYNVRVFGSVARGEDDERSDVDLLVEMELGRSLLDVGGLYMDLRELLGCEVDVVTQGALHGEFGERVLTEAVRLEALATQ
jgi:predicted nucleotidyltransferase